MLNKSLEKRVMCPHVSKNFRLSRLILLRKLTENLYFTVPGDPQDVKVTPLNSTTIKVEWKPPQMRDRNGIILGYHVHVQEIKEEVCLLF